MLTRDVQRASLAETEYKVDSREPILALNLPNSVSWSQENLDWLQAFPFQQFHVLFTLSSECFSSFPHGTCSLSVSHPYLALDEIYHPFWAAIPNNSTLWKEDLWWKVGMDDGRDCHPLWYLVPKNLHPNHFSQSPFLETTIRPRMLLLVDSKFELFPLHSPLLGESLLVSFPPLIHMLKFSG